MPESKQDVLRHSAPARGRYERCARDGAGNWLYDWSFNCDASTNENLGFLVCQSAMTQSLATSPTPPTSPAPPTPREFYIEYPLYKEFTFDESQNDAGWSIRYSDETIDTYCPECGSHSIFSPSRERTDWSRTSWIGDNRFSVFLACSRDKKHILYFLFQVRGRTMQKIGQFPSLATLNLYDVHQYSSVLSKEAFREFTRAIGLAAHGVGVGSFVYLRRIFEGLVEQARKLASVEPDWSEEEYAKSRFNEKIARLTHFLPKFLVENRAMYGILSKGLHELTEAECLAAFPVVKLGIEIILDAKLQAAAEQKKLQEATRAIQRLAEKNGT